MSPVAPRDAGALDRLALRIRETVRHVHENELSGVERFRVTSVSPLVLSEAQGELRLEDGDPDFTVGATLRARIASGSLSIGDLAWVARNDGEWHAFDVASDAAPASPPPVPGGGVTPLFFTQSTPALTWTLAHNLGRYPAAITVYDGAGTELPVASITNPDSNTTVVTFTTAKAGSAVIL